MGFISEVVLKVRYAETDKMGIVHHSRYFPWFEVGRSEFIKECGISYGEIESLGVLLPLVEANAKYFVGARYEDEVIVKTRLAELGCVRCRFEYEITRKKDAKLLTQGYTVHAFTDTNFKPINLKKNIVLWDKFVKLLD